MYPPPPAASLHSPRVSSLDTCVPTPPNVSLSVSETPVPTLPDYPPSVHLILDYIDGDLKAKLIRLGKEITHFNNPTGRYERQYGRLFVHDPREVGR